MKSNAKPVGKRYKHVPLASIKGKTVKSVASGTVQAAYGHEPCTTLYFTDGTKHVFVHPCDERFA